MPFGVFVRAHRRRCPGASTRVPGFDFRKAASDAWQRLEALDAERARLLDAIADADRRNAIDEARRLRTELARVDAELHPTKEIDQ